MLLRELVTAIPDDFLVDLRLPQQADIEIKHLAYDSRRVEAGSLFFAIPGTQTNGARFIPEAVARGAVAVISEQSPDSDNRIPWVTVRRIRAVMSLAANHFFGHAAQELVLVGVTGTNGKTTTAYLLHSILSQAAPTLLLGTVHTVVGRTSSPARLTTPESVDLHRAFREALDAGCRFGVLEVSSHSLALDRTYGCPIPAAVFTNLTQDHLDFHGTMEDYFAAKRRLFDSRFNPGLRLSVVNGDDPWGQRLLADLPQATTYGLAWHHHVRVVHRQTTNEGTRLRLIWDDGELLLESRLIGNHNVYNILAAATTALLLGLEPELVRRGVAALTSVPGRFEKVPVERPYTVVIDYAHTPDALANVLKLARQMTSKRLICVFGCGGDRDRGKRPLMGEIAARLADLVIVTSDNPRTEDPDAVIDDIVAGIPPEADHVERITDRRSAIRRALRIAQAGDFILLAGKGHEDYQEIGTERIPFDERVVVQEELCLL